MMYRYISHSKCLETLNVIWIQDNTYIIVRFNIHLDGGLDKSDPTSGNPVYFFLEASYH